MTESPFAPLRYYLARGPVPRTSMGVTPLSSLLRAHAPDHVPPPACGRPSVWGSVQVAASPCCDVVLPDVISACLSLDAWTLTPAVWWVHGPIASPPPSAFPQSSWGRLPASIRPATSEREVISGLQSFTHVQASRFAATQVAPTAVPSSTGQPWRIRPSSTPVVTFRCIGYARCPFRKSCASIFGCQPRVE